MAKPRRGHVRQSYLTSDVLTEAVKLVTGAESRLEVVEVPDPRLLAAGATEPVDSDKDSMSLG